MEGGPGTLEITLETGGGPEATKANSAPVRGAIWGAGTVINRQKFDSATAAKTRFVAVAGLTGDGCPAPPSVRKYELLATGSQGLWL